MYLARKNQNSFAMIIFSLINYRISYSQEFLKQSFWKMKNVLVTNIFRKIPDISLSLILSITTEERCERYIVLQ